jgi:hypothetical protein
MIDHQRDMTPVVDLTRKKGTGAERTRRPIYVDLLPPCNNACRYRESTSKPIEAGQYVAALPESAKKSGVRGRRSGSLEGEPLAKSDKRSKALSQRRCGNKVTLPGYQQFH